MRFKIGCPRVSVKSSTKIVSALLMIGLFLLPLSGALGNSASMSKTEQVPSSSSPIGALALGSTTGGFNHGGLLDTASNLHQAMPAPADALVPDLSPIPQNLLVIPVQFSDVTCKSDRCRYTVDQLNTLAFTDMNDFFHKASYNAITFVGKTAKRTSGNGWYQLGKRSDYIKGIKDPNCEAPDTTLFGDAAAKADADVNFPDFDYILIVMSATDAKQWFCGWGGFRVTLDRDGKTKSYRGAVVAENLKTPSGSDESDVNVWGRWAHEVGHMLQSKLGTDVYHPSSYANSFELMDGWQCYPCHPTTYSKGTKAALGSAHKDAFPGWLSDDKIATVGPPGATVVVNPLELDPLTIPGKQAIKVLIPSSTDTYYLVEVRQRILGDDILPIVDDKGVLILDVNESRTVSTDSPGVRKCAGQAVGGPACPVVVVPPPMLTRDSLWKEGGVFRDDSNDLTIKIGSPLETTTGVRSFPITVEYGPTAVKRPDVLITPWLSPPMNTWETIDLWVDSSCNGYESDVGPKGLHDGRRADGTVIGNGDDPCTNKENRLYAKVRNIGNDTAKDIKVSFEVSVPLGMGITGKWGDGTTAGSPIGVATGDQFDCLKKLLPNAPCEVFVTWTPKVSVSDEQLRQGHFQFHSCFRIRIDPVAGEVVISNQDGDGEQENIGQFEARKGSPYEPIQTEIFISNTFFNELEPRTFLLSLATDPPNGWTINIKHTQVILPPGATAKIPVTLQVPQDAPIGETVLVQVDIITPIVLEDPTQPPPNDKHLEAHRIGGVTFSVHTVVTSKLTLSANIRTSSTTVGVNATITATGNLDPIHSGETVVLEYTLPDGSQILRNATTDGAGTYADTFNTTVPLHGLWKVRALWMGDLDHSSAGSEEVSFSS